MQGNRAAGSQRLQLTHLWRLRDAAMKAWRRWVRDAADGVRRMAGWDAEGMHHALVDDLVGRGLIRSSAVEQAFRAVPRHPFLPGVPLESVYRDEPIVTHYNALRQPISSSSQPAIMAIMLEMLALEPGQRVLEIGAGTGYNAALMAHIVGAEGVVVSVDIDPDVIVQAEAHLREAGVMMIRLILGDGALGCPAFAPYDRVILTVGAQDIVPAWRDQLVEGGLLVLPLSLRAAPRVLALARRGDVLTSMDVTMGGFMPLRGLGAPPEFTQTLPHSGGVLWSDHDIDIAVVDAALSAPYRDIPTHITSDHASTWSGYALWLELHAREFIHAPYRTDADGKTLLQQTCGLASGGAVALVVPKRSSYAAARGYALNVRCFEGGDDVARRLVDLLERWRAAGSPIFEGDLHVSAHPVDALVSVPPGAHRIVKTEMQYILILKESFV
jgi:protein-L-isoaspartate(D-aspartate) O-methyltransferase